jgi:hypothetical protein
MASDGKASRSEKVGIVNLSPKTGASSTTEETEEALAVFVSQVNTNGLYGLLDGCIGDSGCHYAKPVNQRVFRQSLQISAKADAEVHRMKILALSKLLDARDADRFDCAS